MSSDLAAWEADALDTNVLLAPLAGATAEVPDPCPTLEPAHLLETPPRLTLTPRPYQIDAIRCWLEAGGRGVVVLPTGAGKTVVAMMAVEAIGARTLVVVPTIELLEQWRLALVERLGLPPESVGVVGGGRREVGPVTVITYQSASLPSRALAGYGLVIFDEVHHLPAASYRRIPRRAGAPYLLGLSATTERMDGRERDLDLLVGPEVYRKLPAELARDRHIAQFVEKRLFVDLEPDERVRYEALATEYRWYMAGRRGMTAPGAAAFQDLIRRAAADPRARAALQAHHQARLIALNARAKIDLVAALLARHQDEKVIVFSEYNAIVDRLSRHLLLPSITYRTPSRERKLVLDRFRAGRYSKLVTGRVLNEGVDVPDASVAIVVSGSAATREYIQRLGRVLRPKQTTAVLYELITRHTSEGRTAARRRPRETPPTPRRGPA
jgi:superfamily II DNA or RNA helicase